MFKNYYLEIEEKPLFILPQQYLEYSESLPEGKKEPNFII